jgi:hypothetical protein
MIENRSCEYEPVEQCYGYTDCNALIQVTKHAARGRPVNIKVVTAPSKAGWDNEWLPVDDESNVTDERFIEDGLNGGMIIYTALRLAHQTRAR